MYWYRLVDAHFDLLPKTARLLGAKQFTKEVCACLAAQPSRTTVLERLALPFARFFGTRDVSRETRDVALLEALAIESLLSENPHAPLFTRRDAESPRLAELQLRAAPSIRAAVVSNVAFRWFNRLPKDGDIAEHAMNIDPGSAEEPNEIGVVFCRPGHSVFHYSVPRSEVSIFESMENSSDAHAGDILMALAGPEQDVRHAFERFAFFLDHEFLTHTP